MVIGVDGSRAFSKDKTGTENYSFQLLLHLAKIDTENSYKVYVRSGFEIRDGEEWPKNFEFKVIDFSRLWTQVGLALETFKDNLDILFVPSHTLPLIRKPGLKTVMTVHDLGSEYLPGMHQLKQRLYLDFITKFQLKTATKLIAVSNATKQDLVKKVGVSSRKVEVVYEGVDREVFKQAKGDALVSSLNKFGLEKGRYFLFVGTIQPRKNLERLIKAFSNVILVSKAHPESASKPGSWTSQDDKIEKKSGKGFQLVLVGDKGWMSDEIYELPKKLGIEDQVKFLGRVEDEKLSALYSGAIALTYPSLFEGFGLPILEAMSSGCPVITSKVSSMPEVVGEAGILVDPYKDEELVKAMQDLISDTTLRDNLISKGFKQVEKFSWEKAAKETLEVLLDC